MVLFAILTPLGEVSAQTLCLPFSFFLFATQQSFPKCHNSYDFPDSVGQRAGKGLTESSVQGDFLLVA